MRKLVALIMALISAIMSGVEYIEPVKKDFVPAYYYKGNVNEEGIDPRALYNTYNKNSVKAKLQCSKDAKALTPGMSVPKTKGTNHFAWLWEINEQYENQFPNQTNGLLYPIDDKGTYLPKPDISKDNENFNGTPVIDINGGKYKDIRNLSEAIFFLPHNRKLLSPGNATLVASSLNYTGALYPEGSQGSNGVSMSILIGDGTDLQYKVTYSYLNRIWCCLGKTEPDALVDSKPELPRYVHTLPFSDTDTFKTGAVIGEAGYTGDAYGRAKASYGDQFKDGPSLVKIKLEKKDAKGTWSSVTFSEMFN